jgi:competence protein ComEC
MKRTPLIVLGILFGLNIFAWLAVYNLNQTQGLEVTFFDIGQGDAIFIETPQGHQILIDGGPDETVLEKLGDEMPFWDRTIDLIILTHPEHDHIAGLIGVLKRYRVENILWTGVLRDTAEFREWQRLIQDEGAQIYTAKSGQRIYGGPASVNIEILYPFESFEGKEVKNSNNTSIITRLTYSSTSFLFTGDAHKLVERRLLSRAKQWPKKMILDSNILKVGHHGSKTSTAKEFLEAVLPKIAIISVGRDNRYGHPHPEVLQILKEEGIKVLRTDKLGDIKIKVK